MSQIHGKQNEAEERKTAEHLWTKWSHGTLSGQKGANSWAEQDVRRKFKTEREREGLMHGRHCGRTDGRDTKRRPIGGLEREKGMGIDPTSFCLCEGRVCEASVAWMNGRAALF